MLFILGIVLLAAWLVCLSGLLPGGELSHVLLLGGLMCLLLAFAKGRDAALEERRFSSRSEHQR